MIDVYYAPVFRCIWARVYKKRMYLRPLPEPIWKRRKIAICPVDMMISLLGKNVIINDYHHECNRRIHTCELILNFWFYSCLQSSVYLRFGSAIQSVSSGFTQSDIPSVNRDNHIRGFFFFIDSQCFKRLYYIGFVNITVS